MATIPTFLRQTPISQLNELLAWSGWQNDAISEFSRASDATTRSAAILELFGSGAARCVDKLIAAIDQIEQLRSEQGQRALYSVALAIGIDRRCLVQLEDPRARAIHLLVRNEKAFA